MVSQAVESMRSWQAVESMSGGRREALRNEVGGAHELVTDRSIGGLARVRSVAKGEIDRMRR
jgi:hypothetical protein